MLDEQYWGELAVLYMKKYLLSPCSGWDVGMPFGRPNRSFLLTLGRAAFPLDGIWTPTNIYSSGCCRFPLNSRKNTLKVVYLCNLRMQFQREKTAHSCVFLPSPVLSTECLVYVPVHINRVLLSQSTANTPGISVLLWHTPWHAAQLLLLITRHCV